jgi:hypothetical protein
MTRGHLGLVGRRMKVVRVLENASEALRQHGADEGLSAAGDSHDDEGLRNRAHAGWNKLG